LALVAPEIAAPAGAAEARVELSSKRRRRPASAAVRKAKILAAMRAKANTPAFRAKLAKYRAATKAQAQPTPTTKARAKRKATLTPAQKRKRALAAKRAARKRRAAQAALARRRAANNKKDSSLSLPTLALLAVAPFLLIGLYLLGADYLRRRVPRKRRGGTGGASLVITRANER
jgi:hypothetical protein